MADPNNITLKVDMDISDAESAIGKFQKTAEKAFSSSNPKLQKMGVQLTDYAHKIDNLSSKMQKLEMQKIPTDMYKEVSKEVEKLQNQYDKAKSALDKMADSKKVVPTSEYAKLQERFSWLEQQVKSTESAMKKMEQTDAFKQASASVTKYEKQLAQLQNQASIFESKSAQGALTPNQSADYEEIKLKIDAVKQSLADAEAQQQKLIQSGQAYKNQQAFSDHKQSLEIFNNSLDQCAREMRVLETTGQAYKNSDEFVQKKTEVDQLKASLDTAQHSKQLLESSGAGFISGADTEQYANMQAQMTGMINKYGLVNNQANELIANEASVSEEIDTTNSKLNTMSNIIANVINKPGIMTAGFNNVKNAVTSVASAIKHRLSSAMSSYASKHNTSFKSMLTMVLKYVFGIRSIFLLYRKLRTTISTGMTSLGKDFSEVQDQINSLKNSWSTFKSSLVSAFQPIYSYVLPALTSLINYLSTAMNALANFIALLTGQSYYYKATKQTKDYGDAVSGTGDSAKEASEELAEYDDLIVITSDDANSSSGGGSSDSSGWQWEKVETTGSEFAKSLKDSISKGDWEGVGNLISEKLTSMMNKIPWNSIYQKAKDFGTNLAKFLNGLITDDLFSALGTTIANAIKTALIAAISFGGNFKWDELGEAIASGINSFVEQNPLDLLVTAFNLWANGILDTLIEAMDKVKWEDVRDHIADAIGKLDTKNIGTKVGKLVTKIVNAIYTLFANKQTWVNLGNRIADGINGFFDGFEGSELAKAANAISNALWTALGTAVKNIHWGDIADDIISVIGNLDIGTISLIAAVALAPTALAAVKSTLTKLLTTQVATMGGVTVGTIAVAATLAWTIGWSIGNKWYEMSTGNKVEGGMVDQIKDIASGIFGENKIKFSIKDFIEFTFGEDNYWNNFWTDFWSKVTGYVKEIPASVKEIGKMLIDGIKTGATTALKSIGTWVKEKFNTIVTKVKDFFGIHSPSTVFQSIGENLIDGLKEGIKNAIKNIATWLKTNVISKITKAWDKLKTITVSLAGTALPSFTSIKEKYDAVKDKVAEITANAKEKVRNVVTNMKNTWEVIKDKTATVITTATDKVAGGISKLKETLVGIGQTFTAKIESTIDGAKEFGNTLIDKAKAKINDLVNPKESYVAKITSKFDDVADFFTSANNSVQAKLNSIKETTANVRTSLTEDSVSGTNEKVLAYASSRIATIAQGADAQVKVTLDKAKSWAGKSLAEWVQSSGSVAEATVNLLKGVSKKTHKTWDSIKSFVEDVSGKNTSVSATVDLTTGKSWGKHNSIFSWATSADTVSNGAVSIPSKVNLKSDWTSVWGWALGRKNLTADQMNTSTYSYMNLWVNLKQGTNSVNFNKSAGGGTITRYDGPMTSWGGFASGGAISPRSKAFWKSIPKYAGGTNRAHGTMFVAGEAGPEVVGHIGARTEVLNKSQLASTMHTAIVNGMNEVMSRLGSINLNLDASSLISELSQIPMPVVVTGQILPATEAFFSNYAGDLKSRIENVEDKLDDIVNLLASTDTSNREEIVIQLDSRTITKIVWDNVEKRYKQTGRYSLA